MPRVESALRLHTEMTRHLPCSECFRAGWEAAKRSLLEDTDDLETQIGDFDGVVGNLRSFADVLDE